MRRGSGLEAAREEITSAGFRRRGVSSRARRGESQAIERDGQQLRVTARIGHTGVTAGMVVMAAGVTPRSELLVPTGIAARGGRRAPMIQSMQHCPG